MAISNFVPEIWSAEILTNLHDQYVYAQAGITNRDYEGDIAQAGDTVHITSFTDPTVQSYTKSTDITFQALTDAGQTLTVSTSDYFAFSVDDIDRRQALGGFVASATAGAAVNLTQKIDTYVSGLLKAGVDTGNKLTAVTNLGTGSSDTSAYGLIVSLRTALKKAKVPDTGRWVIVPPDMYALLLQDDRFIRADASGTTDGLRNGQVGRIAGFDVLESNTVPETTGTPNSWTVIAGHQMACTFAEQIANVEAGRLEKQFGDYVKGLYLYGGKVVRPTALASVEVSYA